MKPEIEIYDTTLRDGSQGEGINFSVTDKIRIAEKLDAFARLDTFTRAIESRLSPHADVDAVIAHERAISASLGGRTVMDDVRERRAAAPPRKGQLSLFADVR